MRPLPYAIRVGHVVSHRVHNARIKRLATTRGRVAHAFLLLVLTVPLHVVWGQESKTLRHALFGDVAVELRSPSSGTLGIGVADARHAVTLDVRATDARRWSDSVMGLIRQSAAVANARRVRQAHTKRKSASAATSSLPDESGDVQKRERAILEEPGVGSGSLLLSRIDSAGTSSWLLYASDADLVEIRQLLDADEARTLARIIRSAALSAAPAPIRSTKRKGRIKRPVPKSGGSAVPRRPS
ncbi:MAG: hypothetical protein ABIT38_20615 [Gemmatimonadaceae bacterium]